MGRTGGRGARGLVLRARRPRRRGASPRAEAPSPLGWTARSEVSAAHSTRCARAPSPRSLDDRSVGALVGRGAVGDRRVFWAAAGRALLWRYMSGGPSPSGLRAWSEGGARSRGTQPYREQTVPFGHGGAIMDGGSDGGSDARTQACPPRSDTTMIPKSVPRTVDFSSMTRREVDCAGHPGSLVCGLEWASRSLEVWCQRGCRFGNSRWRSGKRLAYRHHAATGSGCSVSDPSLGWLFLVFRSQSGMALR
jgi:hypothetical protein